MRGGDGRVLHGLCDRQHPRENWGGCGARPMGSVSQEQESDPPPPHSQTATPSPVRRRAAQSQTPAFRWLRRDSSGRLTRALQGVAAPGVPGHQRAFLRADSSIVPFLCILRYSCVQAILRGFSLCKNCDLLLRLRNLNDFWSART